MKNGIEFKDENEARAFLREILCIQFCNGEYDERATEDQTVNILRRREYIYIEKSELEKAKEDHCNWVKNGGGEAVDGYAILEKYKNELEKALAELNKC